MRLPLISLAAALLISSVQLAHAQTAAPVTSPNGVAREGAMPQCARGTPIVSVRCSSYAGLVSRGSNLFPNRGRRGLQPGSIPLFF